MEILDMQLVLLQRSETDVTGCLPLPKSRCSTCTKRQNADSKEVCFSKSRIRFLTFQSSHVIHCVDVKILFSNPRISSMLKSANFPIKGGDVSFVWQAKLEREKRG